MGVHRASGLAAFILTFSLALPSSLGGLEDIQARYGVLSNWESGNLVSNLTLINAGASDIDTDGLPANLYLCLIRLVVNSANENGTVVSTTPRVTVHHLDGCAHRIQYAAPFTLRAGESFSVNLTQRLWSVAYTDVMRNWYIQLGNGTHQLIQNTNKDQIEFADPFDTEEKYLRSPSDFVLPLTLEDRYDDQKKVFEAKKDEIKVRLIPDSFESLNISETQEYTPVYNSSTTQLPISYDMDPSLGADQFKMQVSGDGSIVISSSTNTSSVRNIALSALTQLLERFGDTLPVGTHVGKTPRYQYRGFMLDVARHFHDKEVIKRQLELMWRYRLNSLHLHLTDDESWAIEIEDIPELTMYGSRQCFNLSECGNYPQLGRELTSSKQYLSKSEYIEIVQFAESLGITVIPEVELPGHATAAIQAMKIRHQNSSPGDVDYRLHDPLNDADYLSVQYFTQGAMNPCVDSMYTFVQTVVENLQGYHEEAGQPLDIVHLAGDEVPENAWTNSPACEKIISTLGVDATNQDKVNTIRIEMTKKLGIMAGELNVSLAFWEDGLINKTSTLPMDRDLVFPANVTVYSWIWQTVWEWWGGDRAFNMANSGYKVVMAPATRYYMDHPHEPHPRERGYYWAVRSTSLRRTFSFRPENYYANIDGVTLYGNPVTQKQWCTPEKCPELVNKENIVGVEAPLFGETIQTADNIDNNVYPRLLAVAERSWSEAPWEKLSGENPPGLQEDFDLFRQSVEMFEVPALEKIHSVKYHLSPPGASVIEEDESMQMLQFSVEFKGQGVLVREEGSDQLTDATDLTLEYTKGTQVFFRTRNNDASLHSYEIPYYVPGKSKTTNPANHATNPGVALALVFLPTFYMM